MQITGDMLIGGSAVRGTSHDLNAVNPATGSPIGPVFGGGGAAEVDHACNLAVTAFDVYRETGLLPRAHFLELVAQGLLDASSTLIERAVLESGLSAARIEGERGRTVAQLRLFAGIVREGRWISATLDSAIPTRTPVPRPDLRMRKIALGPVAVFGASNFPLAFSVAGGDTASAFAAGCPVVVKAHPAHLGTSEIVGRIIQHAVQEAGLPEGVFSLLIGAGNGIGESLVAHPAIKAVAFTGSRQGGLALMRIAQSRTEPIPLYAEMSSINPVFLFPGALAGRTEAIAEALVESITLGAGQFCTNPGIVFGLEGPDLERFRETTANLMATKPSATMLTKGIHDAYQKGIVELARVHGVRCIASGEAPLAPCGASAVLFSTDLENFLATPLLEKEVFGPSSLIVACSNIDDFSTVAEHLEGQLTATLHLDERDQPKAHALMTKLERKVGRIVVNAFPTGVEVSYAMVHGGPFPATSDSRTTSVGAAAIERFLRPVCYQDVPHSLLPESLHNGNVLGIVRLQNGALTK
ncbi:MAG: aldehyde dehydrogenase (NADP(+)) [Acidobacteriaceae bacterium]